jgi:hypothetical protein
MESDLDNSSKYYYLHYPIFHVIFAVFWIFMDFMLYMLITDKILAIVLINLFLLLQIYYIVLIVMTNIFHKNCLVFQDDKIIWVTPFVTRIYCWNDYRGHVVVGYKKAESVILQMKNKSVHITLSLLQKGTINEIIEIIENNKTPIRYDE